MRSGLRIRARNETDNEVRRAVVKFAVWLRNRYEFPIRFPIYLSSTCELTSNDGRKVSAKFFAPDSLDIEPYATVATGHYLHERNMEGRDNALATVLCSVAHEVIHYQQWVSESDLVEDGVADSAVRLIHEYASEVTSPL